MSEENMVEAVFCTHILNKIRFTDIFKQFKG